MDDTHRLISLDDCTRRNFLQHLLGYGCRVTTANGSQIASVTTTSYIKTELNSGTNYYYVVTAVNGNGESHGIDPGECIAVKLNLPCTDRFYVFVL